MERGKECGICNTWCGVGDRELMNALNSLVGYNFVERRGRGEYGIADSILRQVDMVPLLRRYLRREANV